MKGTVKWYNLKKGYGFIVGEDNTEYFVHYTQLPQGTILAPDENVEFKVEETDRGLQAVEVKIV